MAETVRWLVAASVGFWALHPYCHDFIMGADDSTWYASIAADFIEQARAGIWPVYVGQTKYAVLGDVLPVRVAPYFQHLLWAIDQLTFRSLTPYFLQNLALLVSSTAGGISAYLCLACILPQRRGIALALAILYVLCPGVMGLPYQGDLFMSCMALPYVPLVFAGISRSFRRNDLPAQLMMAAGCAACWLCHSPIGLWTTMIAAGTQVVFVVARRPRGRDLVLRCVFGGALLSLGAYVFVSAALLGQNLKVSSVHAPAVLANVRATMPKALLPMVDGGRLSDLQLGYGLWLVLILGVVGCARRRSAAGWMLTAVAGVLVCLLLPVPVLTESLWSAMPGAVIDVTNSAPMQRLYVILAAAIATLLATVVAEGGFASRFGRGVVMVALGAAGVWSGMQARVFFQRAKLLQAESVARSHEYSEQVLRSENLVQARYALTFFGSASRYFSNGVMDPELENRLLRRDLRGYVATNVGAIAPRFDVDQHRDRPALPQLLEGQILPGEKRGVPLEPRLRVEPRQHYLLAFDFFNPPYEGVLQLTGEGLYREYLLPSSGLALSFGSGGSHSSVIPLYLDRPKAVDVRLEFTNTNAATDISRYREFSHVELIPYDRSVLPIRLDGLVPYAATVHSPSAAWLETMRQYQPGWTAEVNGQPVPVRRSPYGLVMLPVEAGESRVQVRFTAPWMLSWAYHFTWLAWVALLVAAWWCRQRAGRDGALAWAGSGTSNG